MRVKQGQEAGEAGEAGEGAGGGGRGGGMVESLRTVIGLIRRKRRAADRIS